MRYLSCPLILELIISPRRVPTIISDLIDLGASELAGHEFATLGMGGAPVHNQLVQRAKRSFPGAIMCVLSYFTFSRISPGACILPLFARATAAAWLMAFT